MTVQSHLPLASDAMTSRRDFVAAAVTVAAAASASGSAQAQGQANVRFSNPPGMSSPPRL